MRQSELILDLKQRTEALVERAQEWRALDLDVLNRRPSEDAWSVLECIEHLNLYGDFYLQEFEKRILAAKHIDSDPTFKSGWFGEFTVQNMLPKDNKVWKMNTFSDKRPDHSKLSLATVDRFLKQQQIMLHLLERSQRVHHRKTTCNTTLPAVRFSLGTTFRFVIYHQQRHFWQAERTLKVVREHSAKHG